jgi:hypothetical protein
MALEVSRPAANRKISVRRELLAGVARLRLSGFSGPAVAASGIDTGSLLLVATAARRP